MSTLPGNGPDAQVPGSRSGDSSIPGCCQTRGMTGHYIGSGPYCYANCMAMALADGTDPGLLEVLTGSPFGLELLGGRRPLFNPLGWDPQIGIDAALDLLGWSCQRSDGGDADAALTRLRHAAGCGPVLAGPVEMGLLRHQPDADGAIGADHYVWWRRSTGTWSASTIRTATRTPPCPPWNSPQPGAPTRSHTPTPSTRCAPASAAPGRSPALTRCARQYPPRLPGWKANPPRQAPGSLGTGQAALALASLAQAGLAGDQREELAWFAVRAGARRLADAEYWLGQIGLHDAAMIAGAQARLVGGLQYPLVTGDDAAIAAMMRDLAPTYRQLRDALTA